MTDLKTQTKLKSKKTVKKTAKKKSAKTKAASSAKVAAVAKIPAVVIENVSPEIDGGIFSVKSVVGEKLNVSADIYKDGHDILGAAVLYRELNAAGWTEERMICAANDRWEAPIVPMKNTAYVYTLEAWVDPVATWIQFMRKKCPANVNVLSDLQEGLSLLAEMKNSAKQADRKKIERLHELFSLSEGASDEVLRLIESDEFQSISGKYPLKRNVSRYDRDLPLFVDRKKAEFAAWYELFPRSQARGTKKHGTFRDCIKRLPDIKKMGFDVIYLPPIHPIGRTHRKGPNNTLRADKNAPGSPWAIGAREGGHKSIHPELGSAKDFRAFVETAEDYGIEIALDLAYQCSPDHPYVKKHPDWFYQLPDGTIRYAENPPKKYQDIYPIDFYCEDRENLWLELKSVILHWIGFGVKIFRVDNPHTKPLRFWEWVIAEVRREHPDVLFLAEAFTRPKVMKFLAKAGFTQSYTYFTWRNEKWELTEYLKELTQTDMKYYFRGNFFANTPDILHEYLQKGGQPAFKIRLILAATLSSVYGIYSGYEFCENTPLHEGSEEYLNSEKYELRPRNWDQPGNIKPLIGRVNRIRLENPALHEYKNLVFFPSGNPNILCYGKKTEDNSNIIVVVVNLDPFHVQEDTIRLPLWEFGVEDWQTYQMKDLITGEKYYWRGQHNYVRLDPHHQPAHILRLKK